MLQADKTLTLKNQVNSISGKVKRKNSWISTSDLPLSTQLSTEGGNQVRLERKGGLGLGNQEVPHLNASILRSRAMGWSKTQVLLPLLEEN